MTKWSMKLKAYWITNQWMFVQTYLCDECTYVVQSRFLVQTKNSNVLIVIINWLHLMIYQILPNIFCITYQVIHCIIKCKHLKWSIQFVYFVSWIITWLNSWSYARLKEYQFVLYYYYFLWSINSYYVLYVMFWKINFFILMYD